MKILALETATDAGSVALWWDGALTVRHCTPGPQSSGTLLPLVRATLAEAGWTLSQMDGLGFGCGPGSFTGLRVACGVAQGLAVGADLPVLPVETLAAMAWATGLERVAVYLDARMGEVYSASYLRQAQGVARQGEITVLGPEACPLPPADGTWAVAGNGIGAYATLAARLQAPGAGVQLFSPDLLPEAGAVAQLAAQAYARGEGLEPAQALPLYVRDKVAMTVAERLAAGGKA